ncbi:MAG TPA: serine/threonine-protein kinase, partial [Polyangiaceae bacterium]|nr:serine/threonine-protein kinase [Polyangiaceae bacterium]
MKVRQPGDVLGGKYRLMRPLARGGMGSVWHAEHLSLSSSVALKLIESGADVDSLATQRFLREARLAAALRSPHVVQIFDYGVDEGTPYIAMELLEGESLGERLERRGRLSAAETARVIQHLGRAMTRAHEAGIVHRDLKPDNVFIVKNDDEEIFKVFDFGIAKAHPAGLGSAVLHATRTGSLLGTPSYMSPEQAEGAKVIDHRTDIWALGVIAFRCLLGRLPFKGDNVGQLILSICIQPLPVPSHFGEVPDGFDAWFARICARRPGVRFESAKEAATALSALAEHASALPAEGPRAAAEAVQSTTGQFANSEVASRPRRAGSSKRVLAPLFIAAGLGLATLGVSKIDTPDKRRQLFGDSRQLEQVALPMLPAEPEPSAAAAALPAAGANPTAPISAALPPPALPPAEAPPPAASMAPASTAVPARADEVGFPGVRLVPGVQ